MGLLKIWKKSERSFSSNSFTLKGESSTMATRPANDSLTFFINSKLAEPVKINRPLF
jgi:hypothetical protein